MVSVYGLKNCNDQDPWLCVKDMILPSISEATDSRSELCINFATKSLNSIAGSETSVSIEPLALNLRF